MMIGSIVVKVTKQDNLHIHIESPDREYYNDLKDFFSFYVPGYAFMPAFKRGRWNGKVSLFNFGHRTLPAGLLFDFLKFHKKKFKTELLEVAQDVKDMFVYRDDYEVKFNLKYKPHNYQEDCIMSALRYRRGIFHVSTASGKSLIITYITKTLLKYNRKKQFLIIVPTVNLVEQFYGDMDDYGINTKIIGRVYADIKEPDKPIVISTWQSLQNNYDWLDRFYGVIVDECHITSGSIQIREILSRCINAVYRIGVTGTLPPSPLDLANTKAFLGPIVRRYSTTELADAGYVSKCRILAYKLNYSREFSGEYFEIRQEVFSNPRRLDFIKNLIDDIGENNILILVNLVDKEGKVLEDYLARNLPDREVVFLWGDTKVAEREKHRKDFDNQRNKVVIATYPIFRMGVNIPSLKYILFASPLKSKISVLQSVGRTLRLHLDKVDGSWVLDIIDIVPYLETHGDIRLKYYRKEGFEIEEKEVCLPVDIL